MRNDRRRRSREQWRAIFAKMKTHLTPSGRKANREEKFQAALSRNYDELKRANIGSAMSKAELLNELLIQKRIAKREQEVREEMAKKYSGLDDILASFLPGGLRPSELLKLRKGDVEKRVLEAKEVRARKLSHGELDRALYTNLAVAAEKIVGEDINSQINHIEKLNEAGLLTDKLTKVFIKHLETKANRGPIKKISLVEDDVADINYPEGNPYSEFLIKRRSKRQKVRKRAGEEWESVSLQDKYDLRHDPHDPSWK